MAEIDPVILELRANLGKYQADLKQTTTRVDTMLRQQERSAQRLEKQMLKSSTAIGGAFRNLAATLGTLFTGRELVGLIDGFTRLQNSLKVAGIEGAQLERVQASLLDLSTRYGVSIESLADLYGKAAQSGKDLGASQSQILQLTEATSQALLITGTSTQQASGAILGLTQALASGTVRAEEFNQINEGGLRPLLQAAAASEKYGGSVAKLRAAVIDGKVSSQEFYQSILAGSQQLEGQASKATLTLAGAFEALTSRLTVYIGQSAQANGVTQALAGGLQLLAENLDTVIPLLAIIGAALGVGFVTNALRARIAAIATAGAMTTLGAAARGALAILGGPVGIAITAVTVGLGYLATQSIDTARSLGELEGELDTATSRLEDARKQAKEAGLNIESLSKSTDDAAGSFSVFTSRVWAGVDAMTTAARAAKDLTLAKIALSSAEARTTIAQLAPVARQQADALRQGGRAGGYVGRDQALATQETTARLNVAAATLRANAETARIITALGSKFKEPASGAPPASSGDAKKTPKGRSGPSGPSAEEIDARFNQELAGIAQQTLSARQALATSAEERAELELRSVELARIATLESLQADKDYSAAQKARVADAVENLAEIERARVERDRRIQLEEDAADIADAEFRAQSDALRQQYDLAKTQAERRELAYEIIALEYEYRDAQLEAVKNNKDLSAAVRERAAIEQAALREAQGRTMEQARRDTAGPLENYFDKAKTDAAELNELYESIAVDGLQSLNDGLTDAIVNSKSLGDVFKNVAKQIIADLIRIAIQQSIVAAFGGGSGGGGGFFGSIFGRASGGYVAPGQSVRVNEGAAPGRVEGFRPTGSGTVIPLGQMNSMAAKPSSSRQAPVEIRVYADEGATFVPRVEAISEGVSIRTTVAFAPKIIDAAANETLNRASRPTI